MSDHAHSKPPSRPTVREVQGFLFTLDGGDESLPELEAFFPEAPVVPIAEVADLGFERTRRRFTQGA